MVKMVTDVIKSVCAIIKKKKLNYISLKARLVLDCLIRQIHNFLVSVSPILPIDHFELKRRD